jgi:hypothetical protein
MEQDTTAAELVADPAPGPQTVAASSVATLALPHAAHNGDSYVYEPLDTDRPHIRLLTLWHGARSASYPYPRTESDEILCAIDVFEVGSAPPYIALSYTWGCPTPLQTIRLNGKCYNIRDNLFDFLKAFGASELGQQNHYLWIDQLSIDQSNTNERGHQVKQMGDIYRNGESVISWLDTSCYDAFRDVATGSLNHDQMCAHMATIFSNRYFSRLWVVQEFLLAEHIQFMCGDVWIDGEVLKKHMCTFDEQLYTSSFQFGAKHLFLSRSIYRTGGKPENGLSLFFVLAMHSLLECEDIRDKVYGLLSIVDASYNVPEINYNKSAEQVYLDTIRIFLTEGQTNELGPIINYSLVLSRFLSLSDKNHSALLRLLEDIRVRTKHILWYPDSIIKSWPPIIHAIGFDPPESPNQWWYEYDGVRYCFPVPPSKQQQYHQDLGRALILGVICIGIFGLMLLTHELEHVLAFFGVAIFASILQVIVSRLVHDTPLS